MIRIWLSTSIKFLYYNKMEVLMNTFESQVIGVVWHVKPFFFLVKMGQSKLSEKAL